ncbi:MAG: SUMF1/EgtB/PvdO family nonheme iron enzyme [Chloroflexi bacterium]|nr:SUMF1/EgtB/PvdO family nonheme iron enzyme [Chloroflexota bacterium]
MSHIFISYSKKNRDYARALANKLLDAGFDVWIDDRIDYGDDWWQVIVKAIRECAAFLVVMTPDSDASKWVQREVTLADHLPKPIFPVLRDGDLLSSDNWSMFLRTQYADVRDGSFPKDDFHERLRQLITPKPTRGSEVKERTFPLIIKPDWVGKIIPEPFEWCVVPAGKVTLEKGGYLNKLTTFDVPEFQIARYPITNAQFEVFVTAKDGSRLPEWWNDSKEAIEWYYGNPTIEPARFADCADCPRETVTWYAAVAFTRWLSAMTGEKITLPTEQQWQRAAQGDDGRTYPWGNSWDARKCNTSESGIGKTSIVTRYPQGASPFGALDMSGNVWEWCLTAWDTGANNLNGINVRVLRGGSWYDLRYLARAVSRYSSNPAVRSFSGGFRVVFSSTSG